MKYSPIIDPQAAQKDQNQGSLEFPLDNHPTETKRHLTLAAKRCCLKTTQGNYRRMVPMIIVQMSGFAPRWFPDSHCSRATTETYIGDNGACAL